MGNYQVRWVVVTPTLLERIQHLGLWNPSREADEKVPPGRLLALCDEGYLAGGLSVALDVRADELLGPLTQRMGGAAAHLKIEEVRDGVVDADEAEGLELTVSWPGSGERPHVWIVRDTRALVAALNDAFREDAQVRHIALLGEWNDALQLWCLTRAQRASLRHEHWFQPEA